ncbi:MAG: PilZ domain-containing protein [Cellvibrionaceae bacterium]
MTHSKGVDDARKEVRFETELAAVVSTGSGAVMPAKVTNISSSGMQLTMGISCMKELLPKASTERTPQTLIELEFEIETRQRADQRIEMQCELLYVRRKTKDKCIVGCVFNNLKEETTDMMVEYLSLFCTPS